MDAGNIKPINRNSVHKICSGQVVLTLATAVKELVENSIDAGASMIEVKLKEYGSEIIEVIDNGKGVKSSDFQSITLKHHTSKINDFSDVEFVSTFGFRGEALSSLCALSDVEIVTCHSDSAVGSLLVYDHDGMLVKNTPTHRQIGTTIVLKNLFYTLPVRHKEFLRNIRREYAKMIQLLTAYCLISVNKRITCTNTSDKGRKTIVLATNSCASLKDNISCVFGSKQVNNLMEFIQHTPNESVLEEYFLPQSSVEKSKIFRVEGYISSCIHGEGRSSTDRQFFFINGRPCDLPKVSKLINEMYHSFNKAQYPFVLLNISLTEGSADVNVTPDKRQIFIPEEKLLLCIVKSSLYQMYQLQPSQMKITSASVFFQKSIPDPPSQQLSMEVQEESLQEVTEESLKRKMVSNVDDIKEDELFSPQFKSLRRDNTSPSTSQSEEVQENDGMDTEDSPDSGFSFLKELSPKVVHLKCEDHKQETKNSHLINSINIAITQPFNEEKFLKKACCPQNKSLNLKDILQKAYRGSGTLSLDAYHNANKRKKQKVNTSSKILNFLSKSSPVKLNEIEISEDFESTDCVQKADSYSCDNVVPACLEEDSILDEPQRRKKKTKTVEFNLERIKKNLDNKNLMNAAEKLAYRKFRSKIAPTENDSAEEELKKEIKKENFSEMKIIGQFNLGFIITQLNDDLFIIDQHATDEKYNFEMLQKETVLETQKLLNPQELNLSAVSEAVLLDNLHIFQKSGFKFNVNEQNSTGNKIQLASVPVSQNWQFGKEDVEEMIFMLTDNPVSMVRPSKLNQMFASRACRKSVMIGTALSVPTMKKLVTHMGEIEQPWNCPHGRPTMRHLFNLNLLKSTADE